MPPCWTRPCWTAYQEWDERKLGRELIAGLGAAPRREALEWLTADNLREAIAMGGLLNETESTSYEVAEAAARLVLAEIAVQDREALALEVLVRDEICERRRFIKFARDEKRGAWWPHPGASRSPTTCTTAGPRRRSLRRPAGPGAATQPLRQPVRDRRARPG